MFLTIMVVPALRAKNGDNNRATEVGMPLSIEPSQIAKSDVCPW